jgi:hypothetical protein
MPDGSPVIQPLAEQPKKLIWTREAEQRLARVPSFLRKMVKGRAESYALELGTHVVTEEHLATLAARRFGSNGPPRPGKPEAARQPEAQPPTGTLPWSEEARERLAAMPSFLREGVRAVAEDVARSEGRLEVNIKLLDRLEAENQPGRTLPWSAEAERLLEDFLADKSPQARMFIAPALESATEQFARERRAAAVERADAEAAVGRLTGGVEWDEDALARVLSAPDFNRAGIKKAAEFNARREGLKRITSSDLTRYRNKAMMRAVQRMKGFGMTELSFDAYAIARERVPRLKDNPEADKRFDTIRNFVAARENPGDLLGHELLEKMKAQLEANRKASPAEAQPSKKPVA